MNERDWALQVHHRVRAARGQRRPRGDGKRRTVVETPVLCHSVMIALGDGETVPMWRHVIEEDEPPKGSWRELHAVYAGKPKDG